jgi:hypothetical protein
MEKKIIPIILGIMGVVVVGICILIFLVLRDPNQSEEIRFATDSNTEFGTPSIDSAARIEIEILRSQIQSLADQVKGLETNLSAVAAASNDRTRTTDGSVEQGQFHSDGTNDIIDSYAQVVLIANRRNVNKGLEIAGPSYLESVFGKPRTVLTSKCEGMTNKRLASKMTTERVGPIRVRMLRPALDSLGRVFEKVKATDPDLYARINTAGALCVRHIRGAPGRTSTHAFGLSVDLNIDGKLDRLGDGKTQLGLTILADFFKTEGWYWGAGFSREDSMHFEVSRGMVDKWIAEGAL